MFDDKSRDELSHNSHFVAFLEEIAAQKDSALQALNDLPTERLQQATGRLLQLEDILNLAGWRAIQDRKMSR